jgi:hypothetical protein
MSNFIDREEFKRIIDNVPNLQGQPYQDPDTIYGDMSRLVVGCLAKLDTDLLRMLYQYGGWRPEANVVAMKACAEAWMQQNGRG